MPRLKLYNGSEWITLDANDADTLDGKHANEFTPSSHMGSGGTAHALATETEAGFMSPDMVKKIDQIVVGADSNQNAWSNIKIGTSIIAADQTTDTLEIVAGTGIVLTADVINDKLTIALQNDGLDGSIATIDANGRVADSEKIGGKTLYELDLRYAAAGSTGGGSGDGQAALGYNVDSVTLDSDNNIVTVPFSTYDSTQDVLLVFQNSTFLQNGDDYTYNPMDNTISKTTGVWTNGTIIDFTRITITNSGDMLKVDQLENFVTVAADGTSQVMIGINGYTPGQDGLSVFQDGIRLAKDVHYKLNTDGSGIQLQGYTADKDTEFQFVVIKKTKI